MSKVKELLSQLKNILVSEDVKLSEEPVEVKFKDYQIGESILRVDGEEMVVGAHVATISTDAEGNEMVEPVADGEYQYEDKIIVIKDSMIAEIRDVAVAQVEEVEESAEVIAESFAHQIEENIEDIEELSNIIKVSLNAYKSDIAALKAELETIKHELEIVKNSPAAEPVKMGKVENENMIIKKNSKAELAALFANNKK